MLTYCVHGMHLPSHSWKWPVLGVRKPIPRQAKSMAFELLVLRPTVRNAFDSGAQHADVHMDNRNEMSVSPYPRPCHSPGLYSFFFFFFFSKCSLEPTHWTSSPSNASDCLFTFCQSLAGLERFLPSGKQTTNPGSISNTSQTLASCIVGVAGTSQFSLHSSLLQNPSGYLTFN